MYDVNYFIAKFEAIPEDRWTKGAFTDAKGRHCAHGHCGSRSGLPITNESEALLSLSVSNEISFIQINDGVDPKYRQSTPKQRVLAALYDIKAKLEPKQEEKPVKERIVYVAIPSTIKEQVEELVFN